MHVNTAIAALKAQKHRLEIQKINNGISASPVLLREIDILDHVIDTLCTYQEMYQRGDGYKDVQALRNWILDQGFVPIFSDIEY